MVGGEAWIGVDGGASGLRAARVARGDAGVELAGPVAERSLDGGDAVELLAAVVAEAAGDARDLTLGVCMPGLRTADQRGIERANHGVVVADLLDRVEERLAAQGLRPRPGARLVGDGVAGAAGELHGAGGHLRGLDSGYYVGVGTGVAEALVVDGRVHGLDELGVPRAWELGLEDTISVSGINARAGTEDPEGRATGSLSLAAVGAFTGALRTLAELVARRVESHAPARVVVAQRLALILSGNAELDSLLRQRLGAVGVAADRVVLSRLRAAPLLGAAVLGAPEAG